MAFRDDSFALAHSRGDYVWLGLAATAVSVAAFLYFFWTDAILLYGDAVAHINIARRVFDSRTPGFQQLGTVWLPLPHILAIPFVISDWAWQTGVGGSVVSMAAYVLGTLGMYRLVRHPASRAAAWLAALIYAGNPNLIYLQATAMTEPLYLALFVWSAAYLGDFSELVRRTDLLGQRAAGRALQKCGLMLAAAMFTRYDGWFLAGIMGAVALAYLWHFGYFGRERSRAMDPGRVMRRAFRRFVLIVAVVPVFWLSYNYYIFGDPLSFARGPHSARAIAERTTPPDAPPYPGEDSPPVAALHFLKAARLNTGAGAWHNLMFVAALLGAAAAVFLRREFLSWFVLWTPFVFYSLSIAYGSVPIFMPVWWPFSYYNVRYGLQLLPAFAVFAALALFFIRQQVWSARLQNAVFAIAVALVAGSYASAWLAEPISLQEARANAVTRIAFERRLAEQLEKLPPDSVLLMETGAYVGALQRAGIPLARVIQEGNWRQWEPALAVPELWADYVVAVEGDAVAASVAARSGALEPVARIESEGKPPASIYRTRRATGAPAAR